MLAKESRYEARSAPSAPTVQAQSNGTAALSAAPGGLARPHWGLRLDAAAKRGLDIIVAVVALALLAPLIMLVALLVRIDSHGPAFFQSPRVGFGGRDLRMLKFRKMHHRAHGLPLTVDDDARFTHIGAILARFKLDELPQFWHVLRGEMSLVGPRPETIDFVSHHREAYHEILGVRPGVFVFSQIAFVAEGQILDEEDPMRHYITDILPQKVKLDLMYARERTLALDLRIVFWSVVAVLMRRQVAVHRASGKMNLRRR